MASFVYFKSNGKDIAVNMDMVRTIQPVENKSQCVFSVVPDNTNQIGGPIHVDGTYQEVLRMVANSLNGHSQLVPGAAPPVISSI